MSRAQLTGPILEEWKHSEGERCFEKGHSLGGHPVPGGGAEVLGPGQEEAQSEVTACYDAVFRDSVPVRDTNRFASASRREPEEAVACFDEAIRLEPSYARAWNRKAFALGKLGRITEAEEARDKYREYSDD